MPVDTFIAYVGVYANVNAAETDYDLIKELHTEAGLLEAYDAAGIERRADGKVKITKKHETPTRAGGGLGGGVGLATRPGVALFPFAAIGGGLLAAPAGGGARPGAVSVCRDRRRSTRGRDGRWRRPRRCCRTCGRRHESS